MKTITFTEAQNLVSSLICKRTDDGKDCVVSITDVNIIITFGNFLEVFPIESNKSIEFKENTISLIDRNGLKDTFSLFSLTPFKI